jgi:DHA1 family bicyclomycin/chloramphenicol resistance-like MFS transporter
MQILDVKADTARFNAGFVVFFIALLLSVQPLSTDLYLPSMKAITLDLGLTVVQSQSTLLALLLGFAMSQLGWGIYSDRVGRRGVLLTGALLYTLSALTCTVANSAAMLIAARLVMGCGLAAMVVCARALIRDLFDVPTGQQAFAKALTGMAITATLSGVAGGWLAQHLPWRAVMGFLTGMGLVALVITWFKYEESHFPQHAEDQGWLTQMLASWRKLLRSPEFLLNTGLAAFTYTEAMLFLGGSSLVLVRNHGVAPGTFGLYMTGFSACFLCGTMACRVVLRRAGRKLALRAAFTLSSLGLLGFVGVSMGPADQAVAALVAAHFVYMLGHGFNQVCSQAGAVAPFPKEAGAAAALSGTLTILCSVVLGQLQAVALGHWPQALTMFAAGNAFMAVTFAVLLSRRASV